MIFQASSFECFDMRTWMYASPTFITEALFCYSGIAAFNDCYSELTVYTVLSYWLVSMMYINAKAMPINDTDYSCNIPAIKCV